MVSWLTSLVPSCLARKGNPLGSVLLSVCFFFVACLFLCFLSLGFCSLPSKSPNRRPTFEVPPELSVLQQLSGRYELMGILPDIIRRQNKLPTSAKARYRVQIPTQYSRIQQQFLRPGFSGGSEPLPQLSSKKTQCHNSNSDSESPTTKEALEWGFDDQPKMAPHANQFSPLEVENASRQHIAVIISHPKTCNIAAPLSMHITAPHEIYYREDIN